jgi:hypothetical protein
VNREVILSLEEVEKQLKDPHSFVTTVLAQGTEVYAG